MTNQSDKEFLLVDENPETVKYFYSFLKRCKLEGKLLHAWSAEEAISILLFENVSALKLIIVRFNYSSSAQVDFLSKIRNNDALKLIPIVVLSHSVETIGLSTFENMVINALIFNPLDLVKFKRIIALAGYACNDLE